jgi:hypothetical protein
VIFSGHGEWGGVPTRPTEDQHEIRDYDVFPSPLLMKGHWAKRLIQLSWLIADRPANLIDDDGQFCATAQSRIGHSDRVLLIFPDVITTSSRHPA